MPSTVPFVNPVRDARRRARRFLAVALCGLVVCVSCSDHQDAPAQNSAPTTAADPASAPPGALLESEPYEPVDIRITRAGATAQRITYRSTSGIDGSATAVTGAVFVPRKPPPPGGWPIVVYAHPTVGILSDCGPSRQTDLLGNTPQVEMLLRNGYLVVMPDYQGLGSKGPHPYLEPKTVAYNVIDAARAVRKLNLSVSTRWAAYGVSQGGQAAWAAAELAPTYGAGLDMVGAVALAPTADMSPLPQTAFDKRMSQDQGPLLQFIVNAVHSVDSTLPLDDYLHGFAMQNNDALLQCSGPALDTRNRLALQLKPEDVAPASPKSTQLLTDVLRRWALPQPGAATPVPVMVAAGDEDVMVPSDWTRAAVRRGCDQGETLVWSLQRGQGHDNINYRPALAWLAGRFADRPVRGACLLDGPPQ